MRKLAILSILVVTFGVIGAVSTVKANKDAPYTDITAEQLVVMKKAGDTIIVDARGGKYFDGAIIQGAIHLSAKETNANTLAKILPSKDAKVVFYCTNTACPASALSAYKAAAAGYTALYKYPGGIEEWKEKGLPIAKIN